MARPVVKGGEAEERDLHAFHLAKMRARGNTDRSPEKQKQVMQALNTLIDLYTQENVARDMPRRRKAG